MRVGRDSRIAVAPAPGQTALEGRGRARLERVLHGAEDFAAGDSRQSRGFRRPTNRKPRSGGYSEGRLTVHSEASAKNPSESIPKKFSEKRKRGRPRLQTNVSENGSDPDSRTRRNIVNHVSAAYGALREAPNSQ